MTPIKAKDWYEAIRMAKDVTLSMSPGSNLSSLKLWHVRGPHPDLVFNNGFGHFSLPRQFKVEPKRPRSFLETTTN